MVNVINKELVKHTDEGAEVRVILYADAKTEITDNMTGADVPELMDTDVLAPFSIAITSGFEKACLDSTGTWHWN